MPITIIVPKGEKFDEKKQEFVYTKESILQLEHSLISLRKWEAKWHKPFLVKDEKTFEETIDYIKCMTINSNVDPECYRFLTTNQITEIMEYIKDPMTATWFSDINGNKRPVRKEIITAEIIYYWMIALNIPVEFQKWHLNQLLTLIKVCNIKNEPSKKMSQKEAAQQRAALNAARRAKMHSKG